MEAYAQQNNQKVCKQYNLSGQSEYKDECSVPASIKTQVHHK